MLNDALVIEMVNTSLARNALIEKIEIWAVKNIFLLDFAKYLSY